MPIGGEVLTARIQKAYEYGDFSDCKIICGPHEFNVHKVIICGHSEWFKTALKRKAFKEGEDGVIKLEARPATTDDESDVDYLVRDDPEMVRHMVSYFYNLKYSCVNTNPTDETNGYDDSTTSNPRAEMLTHAKMFAIAVKYQIDGLRDFAAKSFRYAVHVYWDSDEFLKAVTIVLDSTPEEVLELRHTVFDTIYDHYRDLKHKDEVKDAFRDHPLFAQDLLDRKWDRYSYLEDHESAQTGTTQSECAVCHQYKEELEFVSGLPKMCSKCNSGDFSGW